MDKIVFLKNVDSHLIKLGSDLRMEPNSYISIYYNPTVLKTDVIGDLNGHFKTGNIRGFRLGDYQREYETRAKPTEVFSSLTTYLNVINKFNIDHLVDLIPYYREVNMGFIDLLANHIQIHSGTTKDYQRISTVLSYLALGLSQLAITELRDFNKTKTIWAPEYSPIIEHVSTLLYYTIIKTR